MDTSFGARDYRIGLKRHLADYGPEAVPARDLLRHAIIRGFGDWTSTARRISDRRSRRRRVDVPASRRFKGTYCISRPRADAQKWLQSQSLQLLDGLAQERLLLNDQEIGLALPTPLLVVLITWATAIFISFGLLARPNATIIASLLIAALAVAGAIFMIDELGSPFGRG